MTVRRVVALAQVLTMTTLLLLGLEAPRPWAALAAPRPTDGDRASASVLDAAGRGVGCQPRSARFRGPKPPSDPPWPPGAEPTPTPEPSLSPEPPAPTAPEPSPSAGADSAFLQAEVAAQGPAAQGAAAQEQPPAGPDAEPGGSDAEIVPDVPSQRDRSGHVRGIDISHHNDDIDFAKVRRAGYDFVFIKATQDNDFIDPMFLSNMAGARAAGLSAGGYHFFDYTLDGTVQADHFVDRLELADAVDGALPPVVDVECWAPIGASIHAVSAARLRDFVSRVYERTGRLPIVYTSVFMWREVVGDAEGFEDQPLWAACWGCDDPPSIAPGWTEWAFWQTGIDRVRGVKKLDGNVFSGTVRQLRAMRLRPLSLASGAPATASQEVELDLGGRDATHLRTSPDGETWSDWRTVRGTPRASIGAEEGSHTVFVQLRHGQDRPSPVYSDSIALDLQGPELGTPTVQLRLGPLGGAVDDPTTGLSAEAVPIAVSWTARDPVAGLGDASLTLACGEAAGRGTDAPGTAEPGVETPWSASAWLEPGEACDIDVTASDGAGNTSRVTGGPVTVDLHPVEDGGVGSLGVEGDAFGVIARRGPEGGQATVSIDGAPAGVVDLFAPEAQAPELVFVADLGAGSAVSVSLSALDATASDPLAGVEGYVTLTTD